MKKLNDLLIEHGVVVSTDSAFQRRARLLQSLWRTQRQLPAGVGPSGAPLGSRLPLSFAKETLANFLTDNISDAVRQCLATKQAGSRQLILEERLFANLLSSQPLCFNMFGELQADLDFATRVLSELWPERVGAVTAIHFEYSPGRGDLTFTGDSSAFDVFIEHTLPSGGVGFIGVEVKYHENLKLKAATFKQRYDDVATQMACFNTASAASLRRPPLEQIWRDHLLAGAMLASGRWASGLYVFLYPTDNVPCAAAATGYRTCLTKTDTFDTLTLERFVDVVEAHADAPWVADLRDRYLGWQKLDVLLSAPASEARVSLG